ncbi:MAG TPA: flagellar basal body L-ring protein FlgH [Bacillota bacterium]|nr:flagellar basal body L-ring protein FlgH [Bacillota bacterium]
MKKIIKLSVIIGLVLSLLLISGAAFGDSLWTENSNSLYKSQPRSFKVGDLITIIIVEQATASQKASSSNGKDGSLSAGPGTGVLKDVIPELKGDWESKYEGTGSTTRGGSLTAKLTVTISEITPEGLLLVEGKQTIKVNNENQVLTVKGKIRPEDVSQSNTVYSTYVADAVIEYQGKGTLGDTQRPGILTRIFNWIF